MIEFRRTAGAGIVETERIDGVNLIAG